jgi:6-phosphogluconolactonase
VTVHPVREDGFLSTASDRQTHPGRGPHEKRQRCSHCHHARFAPGGEFVIVADLGTDTLMTYGLDETAGTLLRHAATPVRPGAGPRHAVFAPDGKRLYVDTELGNTLMTFDWSEREGRLDFLDEVSTLPGGWEGRTSVSDLAVHPSGRRLVVANRGHDSFAIFDLHDASGTPRLLRHVPAGGRNPRCLAFDHGGAWLFATNQESDELVGVAFDVETGTIDETPLRTAIKGPVPVVVAEGARHGD